MPDPTGTTEPPAAPVDQPVRAGWREIGRPSRRKVLALLISAGVMVVLLCFASGWFADTQTVSDKSLNSGSGRETDPATTDPAQANRASADKAKTGGTRTDPAKAGGAQADPAKAGGAQAGGAQAGGAQGDRGRAGAEGDHAQAQPAEIAAGGTGKADAARAAADRARADKLAAAQAADARAAAERAADQDERPIVMPELAGRKLNDAMDLATDAGLTAVTVCRTPDGDSPLWWSNWRVTAQDVPAGAQIDAAQEVCLAAEKK